MSRALDLQAHFKASYRAMAGLLIGEVAQRSGLTTPTVRYYESLGLLRPADRSSSGYRRYSENAIEELTFVRKAQALGFSLDEVAQILKLSRSGNTPRSRVLSLAHQHLAAVEERIKQLQAFRDQLSTELAKWDGTTTPTCQGLCQIFANAEPLESVNMQVKERRPVAKGRSDKSHL